MSLRRFRIERRAEPSRSFALAIPVVSAVAGAILGAVPLLLVGSNPLDVYWEMVEQSFGDARAATDTLTEATPLILTGLAAAVSFRVSIINLGIEGQLLMGAVAAAGVALWLGDQISPALAIALVLIAGTVGGGLFAMLVAVPMFYWKSDEKVLTLMMNFVALAFVNYLILGSDSPWRDDAASVFPRGKPIPDVARLPELAGRLNAGFVVAILVTIALAVTLRLTVWGFEYFVVADSRPTASFVGIDQRMIMLSAFALSGAFSGLTGGTLVSGTVGSLEPRSLATGLGFAGILVAGLARFGPLAVVPSAVFVSALVSSGPRLQTIGVPPTITVFLQGLILVAVAGGEFSLRYRLRRDTSAREAVAPEGAR